MRKDEVEQTKNYSAAWTAAISRSKACFRSLACSSVLTRIVKGVGVLFSYPTNEIPVFANVGLRLPCNRKFCHEGHQKENEKWRLYTDNKDSARVAISHQDTSNICFFVLLQSEHPCQW